VAAVVIVVAVAVTITTEDIKIYHLCFLFLMKSLCKPAEAFSIYTFDKVSPWKLSLSKKNRTPE
jgi:hypothetical protein